MPKVKETGLILPVGSLGTKAIMLFRKLTPYILVHLTWSAHNVLPFPLFEVVEGDISSFLRSDYLEGAGD